MLNVRNICNVNLLSENLVMHYKRTGVVILFFMIGLLSACFSLDKKVKNMKDFDENMLDLRIYHENLGDALLSKNKEYAEWFVNDMDSILMSMSEEFISHRKIKGPFKDHYRKRLAPYLRDLKEEIEDGKWPKAIKTYSILTIKCNDCHIDHDIEKEVRDVTQER